MDEIWVPVANYEGIYDVSSLGKIRTAKGKTTKTNYHGERKWKQRTLKQKTDKNGYKRVSLWKDGKETTELVHRLVLISFLGINKEKIYVNHIDGNPSNNYLTNLEWCTSQENLIHAFKHRLNKSPEPIILLNLNTFDSLYFISKAEASKFLGRSHGFVSASLKKGINTIDEYEIFVQG